MVFPFIRPGQKGLGQMNSSLYYGKCIFNECPIVLVPIIFEENKDGKLMPGADPLLIFFLEYILHEVTANYFYLTFCF